MHHHRLSLMDCIRPAFPRAKRTALLTGALVAPLWLVAVPCALAQTPGSQAAAQRTDVAVRQAEAATQKQQLQQQAAAPAAPSADEPPETYPGESADLGPQMLLKQKKRKPFMEFSSDTMFNWTSNALSTAQNPQEAGIVAETLSLAIAPEAQDFWIGKLSWRAGYRQLLWMYDIAKTKGSDSLNANNFEMSTLFLNGNFNFNENWNASLGLDYNRILMDQGIQAQPQDWSLGRMTDPSKWTEVYVEWNPNWSLSRTIPLGDKTGITLGYNGSYHFTRTDASSITNKTNNSDKLDSGFSASFMWSLSEKLLLQPSVRFTHSLYTQPQDSGVHRQDRSVTPGVNLMWMPNSRLSVRWSVSSEFRHSNDPNTPNSSKIEGSTGVTVTLKF